MGKKNNKKMGNEKEKEKVPTRTVVARKKKIRREERVRVPVPPRIVSREEEEEQVDYELMDEEQQNAGLGYDHFANEDSDVSEPEFDQTINFGNLNEENPNEIIDLSYSPVTTEAAKKRRRVDDPEFSDEEETVDHSSIPSESFEDNAIPPKVEKRRKRSKGKVQFQDDEEEIHRDNPPANPSAFPDRGTEFLLGTSSSEESRKKKRNLDTSTFPERKWYQKESCSSSEVPRMSVPPSNGIDWNDPIPESRSALSKVIMPSWPKLPIGPILNFSFR
jgi:hypothetical protein